MKFEHRHFIGNRFTLPRPEVFYDESERFLIVATPWGPRNHARTAMQTVAEYFLSSKSDQELTSPFERLSNLSTTANNLRIAVLLANEALHEQHNRQEYKLGLELFVATYTQSELVWMQAGRPHICLSRPGQSLLPLSMSLDLSAELGSKEKPLPPLPSQLFGINSNPNISINSFRPQENDRLILLNRHWLPETLFQLTHEQRTLEPLSQKMSVEVDHPYWIGTWDLNK